MDAEDAIGTDPLRDDPRVRQYFGAAYERVREFADFLEVEGDKRGLIGPRELPRLWERHILNSAALVPFLQDGAVIDVGSGAGLPGLVIAAMEPEREVVLVEPMDRRTQWLEEAAARVGLERVTVVRDRAEGVHHVIAPNVTARAVAATDKLVKWTEHLVADGGQMVFLKGRSARAEIEKASPVLRRKKLAAEVIEAPTVDGLEPTTVVRIVSSAGV